MTDTGIVRLKGSLIYCNCKSGGSVSSPTNPDPSFHFEGYRTHRGGSRILFLFFGGGGGRGASEKIVIKKLLAPGQKEHGGV